MSIFAYSKVGQYADEVIKRIEKDKGIVLAENGKKYTIDIGEKSVYNKFAKLVKAGKYAEAEEFIRKNQFEVTDGPRDKNYITLGWRQIEKSVYTSKEIKIKTKEQEQISLLIIKNVLGDDTPTWKSFAQMFHAKGSKIKEIFPDLAKLPSWWNHFDLQFREIHGLSKFPDSSYGVYMYDGTGSFMDYITKLVGKKGLNLYSKKDSWNPADLWLVKSKGVQTNYITELNKVKEKVDNGHARYKKDKMLAIKDINQILRKAYKENDICGISLKKSDQKKLNFLEFNLEAKESAQKLPNVTFDRIELNCEYDSKTKGFISKTSYFYVKDNKQASYKCAYKSNTGKDAGNITYEFLPDGKASAFLGKVPKDRFQTWLKDMIKELAPTFGWMPQAKLLPTKKTFGVKEKEIWKDKVKVIKEQFPNMTSIKNLDTFVTNARASVKHGDLVKYSTMMQMVDFTYLLARLQDNKKLTEFVTICYYSAQKKGQKYYFGPFGKLY